MQVRHHQVSDGVGGCLDAEFVIAGGDLIDQEDETARASKQLLVRRAFDPAHRFFVDLARQDPGLQQFVGGIEIQVVGGNDVGYSVVEIGLDDLVSHAQLIAKLAVGAGLIREPGGASSQNRRRTGRMG